MTSVVPSNHIFVAYLDSGFQDDATTTAFYNGIIGSPPVMNSLFLFSQLSTPSVPFYLYIYNSITSVWEPAIFSYAVGTDIYIYANDNNFFRGLTVSYTPPGPGAPIIILSSPAPIPLPSSFCAPVNPAFLYDSTAPPSDLSITISYNNYLGITPNTTPPPPGSLYIVASEIGTPPNQNYWLLMYASLNGVNGWYILNGEINPNYTVFDPAQGEYYTFSPTGAPGNLQMTRQNKLCAYTVNNISELDATNFPDGTYLYVFGDKLYINVSGTWTGINISGNFIVNSVNEGTIYLVDENKKENQISSCLALEQALILKYAQKGFNDCSDPLALLEDIVTFNFQTGCISPNELIDTPFSLPNPDLMLNLSIKYQLNPGPQINFVPLTNKWMWIGVLPQGQTQVATATYWIGGQKYTSIYTIFFTSTTETTYFSSEVDCSVNTNVFISPVLPNILIGITPQVMVSPPTLITNFNDIALRIILENPTALINGSGRVVYTFVIPLECKTLIYDISLTCSNILPAVNFYAGITNNDIVLDQPINGLATLSDSFLSGFPNGVVPLNNGGLVSPYVWTPIDNGYGINIAVDIASNGIFLPLVNGSQKYKINIVINYEYPAQVCKQSGICPTFVLRKSVSNGVTLTDTDVICSVVSLNKLGSMTTCTESPVARGQVVMDALLVLNTTGQDDILDNGNESLYIAYNADGMYIPISLNPTALSGPRTGTYGCQTTFSAFSI
jgi:hypothetical protein